MIRVAAESSTCNIQAIKEIIRLLGKIRGGVKIMEHSTNISSSCDFTSFFAFLATFLQPRGRKLNFVICVILEVAEAARGNGFKMEALRSVLVLIFLVTANGIMAKNMLTMEVEPDLLLGIQWSCE